MIRRSAKRVVRARLQANPAVAIVGPRQSGKTTLARSIGGAYFDLEQERERLRLDVEWDERVVGRQRLILDEAQSWPEVFSRLRGAIDEDRRRNGRFLLTGSVAPALMTHVSESLAGRLATVELTPLLWEETPLRARDRLWLRGGFPDGGLFDRSRFPTWQADYLAMIAQRDLPTWGMPAPPQETLRMLRMLASVHGQPWNASQLGQSLGLSYHTINSRLDWLVGAFLVRRLAPLHANIGKRLTKSPKVYWRDSGLLHALLNVSNRESLLAHPLAGASWEGFVIEQIIDAAMLRGRPFEPFFFRTSDGYEIDLVLDFGRERWAIETKLTSSPTRNDWERMNRAADLIEAERRFMVSRTPTSTGSNMKGSGDLDWMLGHLAKR